jgi:hypothetical protein
MSDEPETTTLHASVTVHDSAGSTGAQVAARIDERPELAVGAAFGGGLLLALILKRLAG